MSGEISRYLPQQHYGSDQLQFTLAETAEALGAIFASSLGPFGSHKCFIDKNGGISFLKDGFSIASALSQKHPMVTVIREIAETINTTLGDGACSAVVILGSLMKESASVISSGIHPLSVVEGFEFAAKESLAALEEIAIRYHPMDQKILESIAATSLGTKLRVPMAVNTSQLVVEATRRLAVQHCGSYLLDPDCIFVIGKTDALGQREELADGLFLDKVASSLDMPKRIKGASIAILESLEMKGSNFDLTIELSTPEAMKSMIEDEARYLEGFITKLKALNVRFIACKGGIDDYIERGLAKDGILAVKRLSPIELVRLERATGARLAPPSQLAPSDLGWAGIIEELGVGEEKYISISKCRNPKTLSLLLRRGNKSLAVETVKAVNSLLILAGAFLKDPRAVPGGGSTEVELSLRIRKKALSVPGRQQMAMEAFSRAILSVPEALSLNAGLDPYGMLAKLTAAHKQKLRSACLDLEAGGITDAESIGLLEPLAIKRQIIISACDAAVALLKCDDAFIHIRNRGIVPRPPSKNDREETNP